LRRSDTSTKEQRPQKSNWQNAWANIHGIMTIQIATISKIQKG
jgi:hypothetical protein